MNQKKIIVDSPFTPVEIKVENNIVEISSFSISRGGQQGKAMYCLKKSEDNLIMTFQTCRWFKLFSMALTFFGLIIALLPVFLGRLHWEGMGSIIIIGFLFSLSGVFILIKKSFNKSVFDLHNKEFQFAISLFNKGRAIKLRSIIGLQIIESLETINSSTNDYAIGKKKFYELNIVFENLERMNLMKMTDHEAVKNIANRLAEFLQKPLWWVNIIRNKT